MKKTILIIILLLIISISLLNGKKMWEYYYRDNSLNFKENSHLLLGLEFTSNADLGFHFSRTVAHKPGFFFHFQHCLAGPPKDDVYENLNRYVAEEVYGDWYRGDDKRSSLYAGGVTVGLSRSTLLFLGAGVGRQVFYRNYLDGTGILGDGGSYYIIDKEEWGISPYISFNFKIARTWLGSISLSTFPLQFGFGIGADFGMMRMGK